MPTSSAMPIWWSWPATCPAPTAMRAACGSRCCSSAGTVAARTSCAPEPCYHLAAMTLTELKYIVAVARERHFGRAAEACFVSQPTLSVAIKKLEEELGVVLFERGGAEVSVTDVGLRVIAQAQKVLEEAAMVKEIARQG